MSERKGALGRIRVATEHHRVARPGLREIATRCAADAGARPVARVRAGGTGSRSGLSMPAQPQGKDPDVESLVQWILGGAN